MLNVYLRSRARASTLALALSVATVPASVLAQAPTVRDTVAFLDSLAAVTLDSFGVPGMSLGVIRGGEVVLSRGYGFRASGRPGRVDGATQFAIASNTKAFVGTSLALLAADGKLALDDAVTGHLPYLRWPREEVTALANVADLVTHRTGLGTFKGDHLWFKRELSARQVLEQVPTLELEYPFRAGYGYSNVMFVAAGEVIASVTGAPWSAFAKTRLLGPLGMRRTVTDVADLAADGNVASGHVTRQDNAAIAAVPWRASGAAGGIWSTGDDMLRWIEANLGRGVFRGDTVWPERVQREVWRPRNTFGGPDAFTSYGMGWFMSKRGAHTTFTHGGGYDGMYSRVLLVPGLDLGVVVLTNSMTGLPSQLARAVAALYGGTYEETWLTSALARERRGDAAWFARQAALVARLDSLRGVPHALELADGAYADASYGTFAVVTLPGGERELRFPHAPALTATLESVGGDHYRLRWRERQAWWDAGAAYLERGADGQVALRLDVPNDDIFFETIRALQSR